jgi:Flp pilus assembly protein TadG
MRRHDAGQSTVEFALILPLFVVMLVAILDVARLSRDQLIADGVARDAARVASTAQTADEADLVVGEVVTASTANVASFESVARDGILTVRVTIDPRAPSIIGLANWLDGSRYIVGEASFVTEFDIEAR